MVGATSERVFSRPVEPRATPEVDAEPAPAAPTAPRVVVLERPEDLEAHRLSWSALAERALEPNVFYQPSVLLPALRAFGASADLALVLILGEPPGATPTRDAPELLGLFPLERRRAGTDLVVSRLRMWTDPPGCLPVPLLDRARAAETLRAFFDWLERQQRSPALLEIDGLPLGGAFHGLLLDELDRRPAQALVRRRSARARFEPRGPGPGELERLLPAADRRELQRQRKRLQELGRVEITSLGVHADPATWTEELLALAANAVHPGGTTATSFEASAQFVREMFPAAYAAGALSSTALRLDGRPVAMQVLLHAGPGAHAYQQCEDGAHARFSPGSQLEIDLMERIAAGAPPAPGWVDRAPAAGPPSVSSPLHRHGERRPIETCLVTPDRTLGLALSAVAFSRWLRRSLRRL